MAAAAAAQHLPEWQKGGLCHILRLDHALCWNVNLQGQSQHPQRRAWCTASPCCISICGLPGLETVTIPTLSYSWQSYEGKVG